jgi:hypothetical protein
LITQNFFPQSHHLKGHEYGFGEEINM